jgi:hypothetical protein
MTHGKKPHLAAARDAHAPFGAWALGLVVVLFPLAALAAPPAGTPIDNTAAATAFSPADGVWLNPASNTVRAMVQALDAVALRPASAQTVSPGASADYAHVLVNRGNATADFRLTTAQLGGDDFDCSALVLTHDTNGDGAADPGATPIADGAWVTLAPGDSLALVLTATVPVAARGSAEARFPLSARAASGVQESVTDTLRTPADATPPALAFWSTGFATPVRSSALGAPLFVQAVAPGATRPAEPDTVRLRSPAGSPATPTRSTPSKPGRPPASSAWRDFPSPCRRP